MASRSVFAAAFLVTLAVAMVAGATAVSVDPTRVYLSGKARSQSLALHNGGTEKARFQVTAFTWSQSATGEMQLDPTEDILFFPSLLEIAPGETRKVRVATDLPPEAVEKSYRLFVDELPSPNPSPSGMIRVLTRLGIPVFLQPNTPEARPQLSVHVQRGHLLVTLANHGNSYLLAQSVRVIGRDGEGKTALEQDLPAWYVLAHGRRNYDVAIDAAACAKLRDLSAVTKTDHGIVKSELSLPDGACAK